MSDTQSNTLCQRSKISTFLSTITLVSTAQFNLFNFTYTLEWYTKRCARGTRNILHIYNKGGKQGENQENR